MNSEDIDYVDAAKIEGNKLFRSGLYSAAVDAYTRAIDRLDLHAMKSESSAHAYCNRAAARLKLQGHADSALADVDAALQHNPCYAKAHRRRAQALTSLGRLEEAIASLDLLLEISTIREGHEAPITPEEVKLIYS